MTKYHYTFFGRDIFDSLQKVISSDSSILKIKTSDFKVFNSIDTIPDLKIQDIFLGWSYVLFQIDGKFYHAGFPNPRGELIELFKNEDSKDIYIFCGATNICALTTSGKLYYCTTQDLKPMVCNLSNGDLKFQKIEIGEHHSIALMYDGSVSLVNLVDKPCLSPLNLPCSITKVSCGKEHTILLSNSGQVFSFGSGSRGQLGHGTIENCKKPTLLEALDGIEIKAIACGGWHSAAISSAGDLYIWGWNESGQLGLPCAELHGDKLPLSKIETVCCLPKIVEFENDKNIESVSCGTKHTAVLTEDSELWTWGWNEYGQLGLDTYPLCDKPCKISFSSTFVPKKIKCAFWSTLVWGAVTT